MQETLKMMKSILTGKESKVNEIQLIKEYQEKLSPNILAYFYSNNYGLLCKINTLYPIINEEDKASFCLQELDKCLLTFNTDLNIRFMTYFSKCYKNRLCIESNLLNMQKRKANINCLDIENLQILSLDIMDSINDENLILDNYNLTSKEKYHCKLLNAGYSINEISNILKLKPITIYKRLEKIKQKILNSSIILA